MSILDILASAQGGAFFSNAASASGVDARDAQSVIGKLAPAIAQALKEKAAKDPDAFESLLDIIEDGDGSDLNDADAVTSREAISDGEAILADIYGSADAAQTTLAKLAPGVSGGALARLGAISATSVLAALSTSQAQSLSSDAAPAAAAGGGLMSVILGALVKGLVQGAQRQLAPRRRRRRTYSSYWSRRKPVRRRRKRTVGLDDIFKDILGASRR